MIILADDLTGAAEAGGVALHYGLTAEIQVGRCRASSVDVVVVDTDSRNLDAQEAANVTRDRYRQCYSLTQQRLFKKVDSVLRGNVIAETAALLESSGRRRAVLAPANPGLLRTVSDGRYWIDGVPLDDTDFANDPEHPAVTADISKLLTYRTIDAFVQQCPLSVALPDEELPDTGIVVGEVRSNEDMLAWAQRVDSDTVPVGSAAFLDAYLQSIGMQRASQSSAQTHAIYDTRKLFVCGSTSESSRLFCRTCESIGIPVNRMPTGLFDRTSSTQGLLDDWIATTVNSLRTQTCAVIAVDQPVRHDPGMPQRITEYLSCAVEQVLEAVPVEHLLAEGGATAEALMQRMGWERLTMVAELAPGVASTRVMDRQNQLFTMKPGSYHWPLNLVGTQAGVAEVCSD